jgi:hypothetical protein
VIIFRGKKTAFGELGVKNHVRNGGRRFSLMEKHEVCTKCRGYQLKI